MVEYLLTKGAKALLCCGGTERTESGGRGSCCEQQFRPGIYRLIGPDMLFFYNQHSILIFFAYQLQQLQPHFTFDYCKHFQNHPKPAVPFFNNPATTSPAESRQVHIKNRRSQTVINLASTSQVRELLSILDPGIGGKIDRKGLGPTSL